ncbi:kelch-like protein 20 [Oscarella lobularis]|uniref:kelch-like protein 20 n=1 Tax=Oscarella lobularis TaxID=121494 RepID=UPI003313AEEE
MEPQTTETIAFQTSGYFSTALFDSFRKSDSLCDVVIVSKDGQQRFPAHRIILANAGQFFRVMFEGKFKERVQADVALGNVDGATTKMLIEYAYTGRTECPASVENVLSLYEAARYVQFDGLFQLCSDWLKRHVDKSTCVSMGIIADQYDDSDLLRVADRFAAVNISALAKSEDFLFLSAEHLGRIISHDELGVKSEDEVLTILQKWMKHDEKSRRAQVEALSKFVRFSLLDLEESSNALSDLDWVSHYHSSGEDCQRRFGCDGVLLVTGGRTWSTCNSKRKYARDEARVYEPNSDKWTEFPSLAVRTYRHKIATSNDVIYSLGGYTSDSHHDDTEIDIVQRYDAKRRQWVDDVQRMHCPRTDHKIVCCDDHIYGMSISKVDEMMCEVFDSEKKTWIPVCSPENALKHRYILASLANKIFAFGFDLNKQFGYMKYDPLENRWCNFKSCQVPTKLDYWCCSVATGDRLYIDNHNSVAVIFDSRDEQFSVVDGFFPFLPCYELAYDLESKRIYASNPDKIAVYDERVNRWDPRDHNFKKCYDYSFVVVERKLTLDFI